MQLFSKLYNSLYENQVLVVAALLKELNVKVSISTIDDTLHEHPDYPSFLSVADSLKKWNIENAAFETTEENLSEIPTPFITTYKTGVFIVVKQLLDSIIVIINQHGKEEEVSRDYFLQNWTKLILVAEANEKSGENADKKKINNLNTKIAALALIPLAIIAAIWLPFIQNSITLISSLYLSVKLIGLGVSLLLLWYDIDKGNPLLKQICSGIQKADCNAVLNAKAASLGGLITWSEVGFIYFAGGLLLAGFAGINNALPILSLFSLLALPYIFFSIYYQWKVAKQWCTLCLMVQAVLFSEALLVIVNGGITISTLPALVINNSFFSLLSMSIPFIFWFLLKPVLKKLQATKYEKRSYLRLKFNDEVFWSLLQKQKSIISNPADNIGILIGNPNAKHTIVKVCNPYCGPCAAAHPELESLVQHNNDINARILFTATDEKRISVVKHLLAIAAKKDEVLTAESLDDWYLPKEKNYETFAAKYPMNGELDKQTEKITIMKEWCDKTKIQFTPTFFIDGYQLPSEYKLTDLNYFMASDYS
jgi:uncharacterized membrane protein